MKHPEFDSRYQQLLLDLDELIQLLRKHGENRWADALSKDKLGLEAHETRPVGRLLSAFGVMGSFTELFLHPSNGHAIKEEEVAEVEQRLADLSSQIWSHAKYMKKTLLL